MKTAKYIITDELGIHARPAGMIVELAKGFKSKIMIGRPEKMVDAAKVIGIMTLCVKCGEEITVTVEGEDEDEAVAAMEELLSKDL